MKIKLASLVATAAMALLATQSQADSLVEGSAENGEAKAITCTACHGPKGNSMTALWPNIAGQNAPYLVAQLQGFKEGTRNDPLMTPQARRALAMGGTQTRWQYGPASVGAGRVQAELTELNGLRLQFVVSR